MKLLVNANLPQSLVNQLNASGHDAVHTRDLIHGNRTPDAEICSLSLRESRILVTKDSDFVDSYFLGRGPFKLLLISTGNISNKDLERIFFQSLEQIQTAFEQYSFVELGRSTLICHE